MQINTFPNAFFFFVKEDKYEYRLETAIGFLY